MTEPRFFKAENNENAEEFIKCLPLGVQTSFTMMATLSPLLMSSSTIFIRAVVFPLPRNPAICESFTFPTMLSEPVY